jgi:hypothetical protein
MSAVAILQSARRTAQAHASIGIALAAAPWLLAGAVIAWRIGGGAWPWLGVALLAIATLGYAAWRVRRMDMQWLVRTLDARRPDMEDSAALLVAPPAARSPLSALQRERLRARIEQGPPPDLRSAWHRRRLWTSGILAALVVCAALLWPQPQPVSGATAGPGATGPVVAPSPSRLIAQRMDIRPPAYTGLPTRSGEALSGKVIAGSTLAWTLRFAPDTQAAALVFHDGTRLALKRQSDGSWAAARRIDRATLYRIEPAQPDTEGRPRQHRIDTIADRPPQVRLLQPVATLSAVSPGQRAWRVVFEASDDHGLAATARLRIVRTEGSGENITSNERSVSLAGSGNATRRRYAYGFDLAALGLVPGDDLIVQLVVSDRRAPSPQVVRGPSVILRWPPEIIEQPGGLDALMKKVMPAYFRSQRQIIIDAEALQARKPRLPADDFLRRSDTIGVDQRLLRLRYGQFLGEESEGAPQLPTNDAPADDASPLPTGDAAPTRDASDTHDDAGESHAPGDGHDHGEDDALQRAARFGEEEQVLERFGHTHDIPEAATLLDPATRELLRSALNEMWGSEQELRTGRPDRALPFAHRALELIKQVQQAERIYLPKLGTELPPIDAARRLTGKREGLSGRADPMRAAPAPDTTLADAWRALAPIPSAQADTQRVDPLDLQALSRWLATHDTRGGDALAIAAAVQTVRSEPGCAACRQRLRDLLWPLLAKPPAAPAPRRAAGRGGDAYLDALREASP